MLRHTAAEVEHECGTAPLPQFFPETNDPILEQHRDTVQANDQTPDAQDMLPDERYVWAQKRGYQPWPARIYPAEAINKPHWPNRYWIKWFNWGDRFEAVPKGRVEPYLEKRQEYLKGASEQLLKAAEDLELAAGFDEVLSTEI